MFWRIHWVRVILEFWYLGQCWKSVVNFASLVRWLLNSFRIEMNQLIVCLEADDRKGIARGNRNHHCPLSPIPIEKMKGRFSCSYTMLLELETMKVGVWSKTEISFPELLAWWSPVDNFEYCPAPCRHWINIKFDDQLSYCQGIKIRAQRSAVQCCYDLSLCVSERSNVACYYLMGGSLYLRYDLVCNWLTLKSHVFLSWLDFCRKHLFHARVHHLPDRDCLKFIH